MTRLYRSETYGFADSATDEPTEPTKRVPTLSAEERNRRRGPHPIDLLDARHGDGIDQSMPEREATPDEAFELGKVAGFDEGYTIALAERDGLGLTDEDVAELFHTTYERLAPELTELIDDALMRLERGQ